MSSFNLEVTSDGNASLGIDVGRFTLIIESESDGIRENPYSGEFYVQYPARSLFLLVYGKSSLRIVMGGL